MCRRSLDPDRARSVEVAMAMSNAAQRVLQVAIQSGRAKERQRKRNGGPDGEFVGNTLLGCWQQLL